MPPFAKLSALHLRVDEKGTDATTFHSGPLGRGHEPLRAIELAVELASSCAKAPRTFRTSAGSGAHGSLSVALAGTISSSVVPALGERAGLVGTEDIDAR